MKYILYIIKGGGCGSGGPLMTNQPMRERVTDQPTNQRAPNNLAPPADPRNN